MIVEICPACKRFTLPITFFSICRWCGFDCNKEEKVIREEVIPSGKIEKG